jgi:serine phosphatase RsbU (regulator of sigma subunit)
MPGGERLGQGRPTIAGPTAVTIAETQAIAGDGVGGDVVRRPNRLAVAVLVIGLVVTGVLVAGSRIGYLHSEKRLAALQSSLTASALGVAPVDLERRLGIAVGVAGEAQDPAVEFRRVIASSMAPAGPFVSASLVRVRDGSISILAHVGAAPVDPETSQAAAALYERAAKTRSLITTRVVGNDVQRFGYLMAFRTPGGTYVVGAGESLPDNRRVTLPSTSPDAALNIALYFGRTVSSASLVESNAPHLPLSGAVSTRRVPFGTSVLTLVASPRASLAGPWSRFLPWGILIVGLLSAVGIAAMTSRLVRRRSHAEDLAVQVGHLYAKQRDIALTLQRSFLPRVLPQIAGIGFAARYIPGEDGVAVGGDWYSVIEADDHRFAFVVGDVSGRGVEAATVMAVLRYTIRAFASLGYDPAEILTMASREIHLSIDRHFATVLIGLVNNHTRELTVASAGHLPLLMVHDGVGEYVAAPVGVPLGIDGPHYESMTIQIPEGATLIAYTDGLIERRAAPIDDGLARLRDAALATTGSVEELLSVVIDSLFAGHNCEDDTAVLGIRWS